MADIINFDEHESIGTHWIALYVNAKSVTYFESFGVEHIPKEIKKFIGNNNIITNIYRIQTYDSIMCGYFCTAIMDIIFVDFLILYQIFFSLQAKRSVIISNKHSIYELPHVLLNDLTLMVLEN